MRTPWSFEDVCRLSGEMEREWLVTENSSSLDKKVMNPLMMAPSELDLRNHVTPLGLRLLDLLAEPGATVGAP
jgi:hypothetical protein